MNTPLWERVILDLITAAMAIGSLALFFWLADMSLHSDLFSACAVVILLTARGTYN